MGGLFPVTSPMSSFPSEYLLFFSLALNTNLYCLFQLLPPVAYSITDTKLYAEYIYKCVIIWKAQTRWSESECVINRTGFLIDCLCLLFAQVSVETLPKHAKNYLTKTNKKSQLSHVKQISYTVHNMCNLRTIICFGSGHQSRQPIPPDSSTERD
jgi:hypothetical protein